MASSSKQTACHPGRDTAQEPSAVSRVDRLWHRGAEWMAALGGALFMGTMVAAVNLPYGWFSALLAGGKQALWTALIAGLLTRFCRYLCVQTSFRLLPPMLCATLGPSALAVLGVAVLHNLEGTANPWGSVLVTVVIAPAGFWMVAHNMRRVALAEPATDVAAQPRS
jgi:hypothetical protein